MWREKYPKNTSSCDFQKVIQTGHIIKKHCIGTHSRNDNFPSWKPPRFSSRVLTALIIFFWNCSKKKIIAGISRMISARIPILLLQASHKIMHICPYISSKLFSPFVSGIYPRFFLGNSSGFPETTQKIIQGSSPWFSSGIPSKNPPGIPSEVPPRIVLEICI